MTLDVRIEIMGETLTLLPERAVFWERDGSLLIADPHFGKAASFRAAGVPVPHGTTLDGVRRLDVLLARTRPGRVIFLGDFLHARSGRSPATFQHLTEWRALHPHVEMVLVRGNHDRNAGDPPPELRLACVDAPLLAPPFAFTHRPGPTSDGYVLSGHIHPGADLVGPARQHVRLPCFWFREKDAVLPAFGDFTGLASIAADAAHRVFVVTGDAVLEVSSETALRDE
ncbi:MAG: ligase-associated DNA damage response endonuclease PdeM [Gemmatimonadota bacterium]|nr:ligase-associated DNA damage response endonuclease PdeM [Gemmatimonadota bacterium]